jgi:hypothetical protein
MYFISATRMFCNLKQFRSISDFHHQYSVSPYVLVPDTVACNLFDIYLLLYVQSWTPDDGWRDRLKHVECYSKIK